MARFRLPGLLLGLIMLLSGASVVPAAAQAPEAAAPAEAASATKAELAQDHRKRFRRCPDKRSWWLNKLPADVRPVISLQSSMPWQPRGGEIIFKVSGLERALTQASFTVCFRWRRLNEQEAESNDEIFQFTRSPIPVRIVKTEGSEVTAAVVIPPLPPAPDRNWPFDHDESNQKEPNKGVYTPFNLVPVAAMMVRAYDNLLDEDPDNDIFFQTVLEIGVTNWYAALTLTFLVLLGFTVAIWRISRLDSPALAGVPFPLRLITGPDGRTSLSQLQILIWSFVVGAGAIYVMSLSGELIVIPLTTLALLGISGGTSLSCELKNHQSARALAEAGLTPPPLARPAWSDLITCADGGEIDVSRVQMLCFTMISALFVTIKIITGSTIPEIPENFLALMGLSNGVFVTSRLIRPAVPAVTRSAADSPAPKN